MGKRSSVPVHSSGDLPSAEYHMGSAAASTWPWERSWESSTRRMGYCRRISLIEKSFSLSGASWAGAAGTWVAATPEALPGVATPEATSTGAGESEARLSIMVACQE